MVNVSSHRLTISEYSLLQAQADANLQRAELQNNNVQVDLRNAHCVRTPSGSFKKKYKRKCMIFWPMFVTVCFFSSQPYGSDHDLVSCPSLRFSLLMLVCNIQAEKRSPRAHVEHRNSKLQLHAGIYQKC